MKAKINMLSSNKYEDSEKINYGDCTIIDNGQEIILYDCGSLEHAKVVCENLKNKNQRKVSVILSHNDKDHFEGINYLKDNGKLDRVYTILLLKHLDDILEEIDDNRKNRESLKIQIKKYYDNIASLEGYLEDVMILDDIIEGVKFVGPKKDFLVNVTAKHLDSRKSDNYDSTTIYNATSVQVVVDLGNDCKVLLVGDAVTEAFDEKMKDYDVIQLPHHGNVKQASTIFEKMDEYDKNPLYLISDNTGTDNGGSDNLYEEELNIGRRIKNTKKMKSDIVLNSEDIKLKSTKNLGYWL